MSVTYHGDHASYHDDLTAAGNYITPISTSINSLGYYSQFNNPIDIIKYDNDGNLTVHKKLVDAIMNMILDDKEMKDKFISILTERILEKNKNLKLSASELQKTFS